MPAVIAVHGVAERPRLDDRLGEGELRSDVLRLALRVVEVHEVADRDPTGQAVLHVAGLEPGGDVGGRELGVTHHRDRAGFVEQLLLVRGECLERFPRVLEPILLVLLRRARGLEILALRVELVRHLLQTVELPVVGLRRRLRVLLARADVLHVLDVADRGVRCVGVAVDVRSARTDDVAHAVHLSARRVELLLGRVDLRGERRQLLGGLVDLRGELHEHLLVLAHLVGERGERVGVGLRCGRRRCRRRRGRRRARSRDGGRGRRRGGGRRLLRHSGTGRDEEHGDQRTGDECASREHSPSIGTGAVRVEPATVSRRLHAVPGRGASSSRGESA